MRYILDTKQDPTLEVLRLQIYANDDQYEQKKEFIKKQLDNAKAEHREAKRVLWGDFKNRMIELKKLPSNYNDDDFTMGFGDKEGATQLFIKEDHEMPSIESIMGNLFR